MRIRTCLAAIAAAMLVTDARAIVDGIVDSNDAHPYVVKVELTGPRKGICSGFLASPRVVYTAAHCVHIDGKDHSAHVSVIVSTAGQQTRLAVTRAAFPRTWPKAQSERTRAIELWKSGKGEQANFAETAAVDFAVLTLERDAPAVRTVRTLDQMIPMPRIAMGDWRSGTKRDADRERAIRELFQVSGHTIAATVVGFGSIVDCYTVKEPCRGSGVRRYRDVNVHNIVSCPTTHWTTVQTQGFLRGAWCVSPAAMAPGDSGGPLLLKTKSGELVYAGAAVTDFNSLQGHAAAMLGVGSGVSGFVRLPFYSSLISNRDLEPAMFPDEGSNAAPSPAAAPPSAPAAKPQQNCFMFNGERYCK